MPQLRTGLLSSLVLCAALGAQKDPGTSYFLRVHAPLGPSTEAVLRSDYDVVGGAAGGPLEVVVWPHQYRDFQKLKLPAQLIARGRPYREIAALQPEMPDTNYYTAAEIIAEIDKRVAAFPGLAQKVDVSAVPGASTTHDNRSIYGLKISDNVNSDEDEPAILLASQHHARELTTPLMVFKAVDEILRGYATDPALKALVDGYEIYVVPCVNPDGVEHVWNVDNFWRKNRRDNGGGVYGVDLNRNYPFLYGLCGASTSTRSETYRGPGAASEPETRTMMALGRLLRPEVYLDFHSYGREVLFTYAPCATVAPGIRAMINRYADTMRGPMSYALRAPSASGEAPEWHWAESGTMSFLTEVNTSFQPPFADGVSEAARVWPGVRAALTTWRPAVRGHVRSIFRSEPVAAAITYAPNPFSHGEQAAARARDGRYALWLPPGTYDVTWSAPGFQPAMRRIQVTSFDNPQTVEVLLVPTMPPATLGKQGTDRIGTTTSLTYASPGDVGDRYWIVLALGTTPGIDLGAGRTLPLNPDGLFFASLTGILVNNTGIIPGIGQATATFPIPNVPGLVGVRVFAGGLTQNGDYLSLVKNHSAAVPIVIQR